MDSDRARCIYIGILFFMASFPIPTEGLTGKIAIAALSMLGLYFFWLAYKSKY